MSELNKNISTTTESFDVAIAGGGLAGLSLAIQCAKAGYKTVLIEKESYPFHRVCGEYISMESWDFLNSLGLLLPEMNLPVIKKLVVTSPNGNTIKHDLPLGGFGISRFTIDDELAKIAKTAGVSIMENSKVTEIIFNENKFDIKFSNKIIESKVAIAAIGKRSNLDVKWKRSFIMQKPNKLNNYIGVKYHIEIDFPADTIALHNFENGYCGLSRIEKNKYCLCYLTSAANLAQYGNSFKDLEQNLLCKNPHLKEIFSNAKFLFREPVTISQISFQKKSLLENHVLMIGDAAGMITPLCGNGMSMALHASKIAFTQIDAFLQNKISRNYLEHTYEKEWNRQFAKRLKTGRLVQTLFGKRRTTNIFIAAIKPFPIIISSLIKLTHGKKI